MIRAPRPHLRSQIRSAVASTLLLTALFLGACDSGPGPDRFPPTWPAGSTLSASGITCCQVDLAWTAAVDARGVTGYRVTMNGLEAGRTESRSLSLRVEGLEPETDYLFEVEAEDGAGNLSADGPSLQVTTERWVPRDPRDLAPAIDRSVATQLEVAASFLYTGEDPIQRGVAPGTIEARRMAVLRGRVTDEDGEPLAGVDVRVLGHAELGYTATREDGRYDLVVNGGGQLVVQYRMRGALTSQRSIEVPWQGWLELPEVALVAPDVQATEVSLGATASVARGSAVEDGDGRRQATLVVPAGQQAEFVLPDGTRQAASRLNIRATEFTVGERGQARMPGVLPEMSAYTYAVELSADEAEATGAETVAFAEPMPVYVEDFLGYGAGTKVPVGVYDRARGVWVPEESGRVIAVLGVSGGLADVDVDGDGAADQGALLSGLGLTDEERGKLAELYPAGATLWRVQVAHFSAFDFNWGLFLPDGASASPNSPQPPCVDGACQTTGSVLDCQNQTLGEDLPLVGLPFGLHYRSDRVPGRLADFSLDIPLRGPEPYPLTGIELEVNVAGQVLSRHFPADPDPATTWDMFRFTWDGLDAYGRELQGRQRVEVKLGYTYHLVPTEPEVFGDPGDEMTGSELRDEVTLWKTWWGGLGVFDARAVGLGGWMLGVHHVYDPVGKTLLLGSGGRRSAERLPPVIETLAGNGARNWDPAMEGKPATEVAVGDPLDVAVGPDGSAYVLAWPRVLRVVGNGGQLVTVAGGGTDELADGRVATEVRLFQPEGLDVGPDGSVYIAETAAGRVLRVTPDGIVHIVAGTGERGHSGDGGPALAAQLDSPADVALAADGSLWVSDRVQCVIRKIDTAGNIRTLAGQAGSCESLGDGGPARDATLTWPSYLAVGPGGSLYVTEGWEHRVRRIDAGGTITTVAGTGESGEGADGVPATESALDSPVGIAVDRDGALYVASETLAKVKKVGPDGIVSTVAGTGDAGFRGDLGPAGRAWLDVLAGLAVDPEGQVIVAEWSSSRLRRVRPAIQGLSADGEYVFPSEDGGELYIFGADGRHLRTLHSLTGATLWSFEYDAAGRLTRLVDVDGDATSIARDASGSATAIQPPFGPATQLGLGADGYLANLTDPAGGTHQFRYSDRGLLTGMTDARSGEHVFEYDDLGFIARDEDPTGAAKTLTREERPEQGGFTTLLTSAEGRMTAYDVRRLPEGGRVHANTFPSGVIHRVRYARDGSEQAELGDGRVIASEQAGDPRFGVQVKRTGLASLTTPGGLVLEYQASREVQGGRPGEPLTFFGLRTEETVNGRTWVTGYSRDSRRFETQSPEGRTEWTTLDEAGRVVRREWLGADLYPVRLEYDAHGRLLRVLQGEGGEERVVSLGWATDGQLATLVDPLGRTTSFERDANGRVTRQVLPDGRAIGLGWDAHGNATSVTPPGRPIHGMAYTPVDLLQTYDPPAVAGVPEDRTRYAFDRDRALVRFTRPDGGLVDIALDAGGRVDVLTHPDGQVDFEYEVHSGLPQQITTSDGVSLLLAWDGILLLEEILSGPFSLSIARTYSNDLQLESLRVGGQASVGFVHDQDGLLTEAGNLYLYRDPATGRLTGTELDQVITSLAYDGFGATAAFDASAFGESLFSVGYERDMLGRIVRKDEAIQGEVHSFEYGYDDAGRLVEVVEDDSVTTSYEYDSNGNRLRLTSSDGTDLTGTYDDQDRMLSYGGATYRYTAAGELQSKTEGAEVTTYRYDALGNLRQVTLPDGREIAYLVDGRNRRVAKLVDGVMERGWAWLDALRPAAEVDANGDILSEFVYAGGVNVPEYMLQGGEVFRLVKDHLGSVRLVVNAATGEVAQRLDYGPWGEVLVDSNPGFQPFGFAGGLYDPETGLVRFGLRDYSPKTAMWTDKEPLGIVNTENLYTYSLGDPVNLVDVSGLVATAYDGNNPELRNLVEWARENSGIIRFTLDAMESDPSFGLTIAYGSPGGGSWLKSGVLVVDPCEPNQFSAVVHELGSIFQSRFLAAEGTWQPRPEWTTLEGNRAHNFGEMIREQLFPGERLKWYGGNEGKNHPSYGVPPALWDITMGIFP